MDMRYLQLSAMGDWPPPTPMPAPRELPLQLPQLIQAPVLPELCHAASDKSPALPPLCLRRFMQELCSIAFLLRLEVLSGRDKLLPDAHLLGGGYLASGENRVPIEPVHPHTGLRHALVVLVALTSGSHLTAGDAIIESATHLPVDLASDSARWLVHYYYSPAS